MIILAGIKSPWKRRKNRFTCMCIRAVKRKMAGNGVFRRFERFGDIYRGDVENELKMQKNKKKRTERLKI